MGILEKIKDIELEISRTQKNKATEYHLGLLKAKLAKYRSQLLEAPKGSKGAGEGFEVTKAGDARVAMIGFPSVGKSTLLNKLTESESAVDAYEFTTLTCVPGVIKYKGARIQLLDLPGIIEGAAQGKGRGRQVIAVGRTAVPSRNYSPHSQPGSSADDVGCYQGRCTERTPGEGVGKCGHSPEQAAPQHLVSMTALFIVFLNLHCFKVYICRSCSG